MTRQSGTSTPMANMPSVKTALNDIKESVAQPFALPRRPKTDAQAQRLYFHIRTLCFWLDAASDMIRLPFLDQLPFSFGVEALIGGLLPIVGDVIGFILGLYIVLLCMQFGLPASALWKMFTNCLIDVIVGAIPIIGDILDVAFKSNMRNLQILEDHLLSNPPAPNVPGMTENLTHFAIRIPPSGPFWPKTAAPTTESMFSQNQSYTGSSFFSNILGSSRLSGSGSTSGWNLGGCSKAQVEDVGGWTGESARMIWHWILALLARVSGKTFQLAGDAARKGKKKAY